MMSDLFGHTTEPKKKKKRKRDGPYRFKGRALSQAHRRILRALGAFEDMEVAPSTDDEIAVHVNTSFMPSLSIIDVRKRRGDLVKHGLVMHAGFRPHPERERRTWQLTTTGRECVAAIKRDKR